MIDINAELFAIVDLLTENQLDYAVCGGLAVAIHGYPRATQDIDLVIQMADLPQAQELLASIGFTIPGGIIPFATGAKEELQVFRVSKAVADQLLTLELKLVTAILDDVWSSRVMFQLDSRKLCVVSRVGLAKMKRLAGRLKDLADLEELGIITENEDDESIH